MVNPTTIVRISRFGSAMKQTAVVYLRGVFLVFATFCGQIENQRRRCDEDRRGYKRCARLIGGEMETARRKGIKEIRHSAMSAESCSTVLINESALPTHVHQQLGFARTYAKFWPKFIIGVRSGGSDLGREPKRVVPVKRVRAELLTSTLFPCPAILPVRFPSINLCAHVHHRRVHLETFVYEFGTCQTEYTRISSENISATIH